MKAIQFDFTVPRYVAGVTLGRLNSDLLWSGIACIRYREVPEPALPNQEWVKVKTRYGGICGSDYNLLHLNGSPSSSVLASFPFTIGHENCGTIVQVGTAVRDLAVGERVVVEPSLSCRPRGLTDLCDFCARGETQRCEHITQGAIAAGPIIGTCRDTGGSWSPFFVAHSSQVVRVPPELSDEDALLIEPFATSLHAVLQNMPRDNDTVLVIGAGIIGLGVIAALRALGSRSRIIVFARHKVQQELAVRLGADVVLSTQRGAHLYAEYAEKVGGKLLKPMLGKPVLIGGANTVFECVGRSDTLDDSLRLARGGGRVVLLGLASMPKRVDWTPMWMKELQVHGTYGYGTDEFQGARKRTFELAVELVAKDCVDLAPLLTHRFPLGDYARAFHVLENRGRERAIKVAFEFP